MLRLSLSLAAVALAVVSTGCTHCDTCDDFPIPCVGGNCGPLSGPPIPGAGSYTPVNPSNGYAPAPTQAPNNGTSSPALEPSTAAPADSAGPAPSLVPGSELPQMPSTSPAPGAADDKSPAPTPAPAPGPELPPTNPAPGESAPAASSAPTP